MRKLVEIRFKSSDSDTTWKPCGIGCLLKEGVEIQKAREIIEKVAAQTIAVCEPGDDGEILHAIQRELAKIGDIYSPSVIGIRTYK